MGGWESISFRVHVTLLPHYMSVHSSFVQQAVIIYINPRLGRRITVQQTIWSWKVKQKQMHMWPWFISYQGCFIYDFPLNSRLLFYLSSTALSLSSRPVGQGYPLPKTAQWKPPKEHPPSSERDKTFVLTVSESQSVFLQSLFLDIVLVQL